MHTKREIANANVKSVKTGALFDTAWYRSLITSFAGEIEAKIVGGETEMLGGLVPLIDKIKVQYCPPKHRKYRGIKYMYVGISENIVLTISQNRIRLEENSGIRRLMGSMTSCFQRSLFK